MKHSVRSAAAVITASVLGGAGVAVAASGIARHDASSPASGSKSTLTNDQSAALGTVQQLLGGTDRLDQRLANARRVLAHQMKELEHRRSMGGSTSSSTTLAGGSVGSSVPVTSPAPPAHTTTGASGTGAPPTHTRTGASGGHGSEPGDGGGEQEGHDD